MQELQQAIIRKQEQISHLHETIINIQSSLPLIRSEVEGLRAAKAREQTNFDERTAEMRRTLATWEGEPPSPGS